MGRYVIIVLVGILVVTTSGCDSFRKKFVRKAKVSANTDKDQPVLEPYEYPDPQSDPAQSYAQHYAMVKVFYKDLWQAVEENATQKNMRFHLQQVTDRLVQMKSLLNTEHQPRIDKLNGLLDYYRQTLNKDEAFRNRSRVQSDLREFDRLLRQMKPEQVKDYLIQANTDESIY